MTKPKKRREKKTKPEPIVDELWRRFHEGDDFKPKPGEPLFRATREHPTVKNARELVARAGDNLGAAIVALVEATIAAVLVPVVDDEITKAVVGPTKHERPEPKPEPLPHRGKTETYPPASRSSTDFSDGAAVQAALDGAAAHDAAIKRDGLRITKGALDLLRAIVQHADDGITRRKLIILTGLSPSSFRTYMPVLKSAGYVIESHDRFYASNDGKKRIGAVPPLPTGEEALEYWLDHLPEGEAVLLGVLSRASKPMSKEELAAASGYTSSSVRTYMPTLCARELAENTSDGYRIASELA